MLLRAHPLLALLNIVVLPLLLILFSYIRILLCKQSSEEVRSKAAQTSFPHLVKFSCLCSYDVIVAEATFDASKTTHLIRTSRRSSVRLSSILSYTPEDLHTPTNFSEHLCSIFMHVIIS